MNRKDFLSTGILSGVAILNLPSLSFAQSGNTFEQLEPFNIVPGETLIPGPMNADVRTIIHANQTGIQVSNVEVVVGPKQMGPSPHVHQDLDELMYVLEGEATVMIGEEIYKVPAGGWNFRPRQIVHSFWNGSDVQLRFIDFFFNQNFEDYLDEMFHKIIPEMISKGLTPQSPEIADQFAVLDKKFGVSWYHNERKAIVDKYGLKD